MRGRGFQDIVVWVVLFAVFGPILATMMTASLDATVSQLAPYISLAGAVVLVVLALRMFFR